MQTQEELAQSLTPALRELFDTNQVYISEGRDPRKPIVRWSSGAQKGTFVVGTGVAAGVPSAENGRRGAVKQSSEYRDLLEKYVTPDKFQWLLDQLFRAMEGGPVFQDCPACDTPVEMYRKADTTASLAILSQMIGKATEHKEINIEMQSLHMEIEAKVDPGTLRVNRLDPSSVLARRAAYEALEDKAFDAEAEVVE